MKTRHRDRAVILVVALAVGAPGVFGADRHRAAARTDTPSRDGMGMSVGGRWLAYRALDGEGAAGGLLAEDLATGATRQITTDDVYEAAWSPANRDLIAYTFAAGTGTGLAVTDVSSGATRILVPSGVVSDRMQWDPDGGGLSFLAKERAPDAAGAAWRVVVRHVPADAASAQGLVPAEAPGMPPGPLDGPVAVATAGADDPLRCDAAQAGRFDDRTWAPQVLGSCTSCPQYDFGPLDPTTTYQTHSSSIAAGGCKVYAVNVTQGSSYRFTFCEGGGAATWDTVLDQLSAGCLRQATNDDSCALRSQLDFTASVTGVVYVKVRGFATSTFGAYTLAYRLQGGGSAPPCPTCPQHDFGPLAPTSTYQTHSSSIAAGGCRVYAVNVTQGCSYRFTFCEGGGGATWDTALDQLSAACVPQASNDDACGSQSQLDFTAAASGIVYLRVRGATGSAFGSYTLAYRALSCPAADCTSCPGSDFGPLDPTATYQTHSSSITAGGCKVYAVDVTQGCSYRFTFCEGGGGATWDTVVDQISAGCVRQATNDDACAFQSQLDFRASATGVVFVKVRGFTSSSFGSYTLAYRRLTCASGSCTSCPQSDFGPLNPTTSYQTHASSIASGGCKVYAVNVTQGCAYRFTFCEGGGDAAWDTVLDQISPSCLQQASNDDACGAQSQLDFTAASTGTIYVRVRGNGAASGGYTLAYRTLTCAGATCTSCPQSDFGPLTPTTTYQTHSSSIVSGSCKVYAVNVTQGSSYRFTFCEGGGAAAWDTVLDRRSGACVLEQTVDDSCGLASRLDFTAATTGTFFITVRGFASAQGPYTLAYVAF